MIILIVPKNLKIHGALFLVALLYGANYSIAKVALPAYLEPFGFIVLRITAATVLFWLFSFWSENEKIKDRKDLLLLFLCSLFGVGMNQLLFFKGLSMTTPINASVIMTTSPIMVLITAYLLGREKITIFKALGVLVAAVGAYLLVTKDGISISEGTFLGDVLILLNGTSFAVYLVLVKPLMIKYKPITVIKWIFLFGIIWTLPFGYTELTLVEWERIPNEAWLSIAYVIFGATVSVYLLNSWALQFVNSSIVGIYIYFQPIISTIVAVSFRGDPLEITTVLYSLLIMIGVYIVSRF